MTTILIQPRDPLIVRDGRPFTADPGARARSLGFPMPSTIVGVLRTIAGSDVAGHFVKSSQSDLATLLQEVTLRGPLLAEMAENQWQLLAPAPADALGLAELGEDGLPALDADKKPLIGLRCLEPISTTALTDLQSGLALVGLQMADSKAKPAKLAKYWHWEKFRAWLMTKEKNLNPKTLGHDGPTFESRTHVSINHDSQTAQNGALFQTQGLEFRNHHNDGSIRELALLLETTAKILPQLRSLGGERRLMHFQTGAPALPDIPAGLLEQVTKDKACRIVLLTPAIFDNGYLPLHTDFIWQEVSRDDLQVRIKAVVNQRYQTISGWDFAVGKPKSTRRVMPAGSVFFVSLETQAPETIQDWLKTIWLHNHSDQPQDNRDGFGLMAVGTWNGQIQTMVVS